MYGDLLIRIVQVFTDVLNFLIFVRILLSWFPPFHKIHSNKLVEIINDTTEPIMSLARKVPHRVGMLDLSPIIAIFGLQIFSYLLINFIAYLGF